MFRFTIAVSAGALAFAFVGGALTAARADEANQVPGDGVECYYSQSACTYSGGGYWSGCDSGYSPGWILTGTAKIICDTYHSS